MMKLFVGIIVAAIAIQIAAGQVAPINTSLSVITTPTYSTSTVSVWGVLLPFFGLYILMLLGRQMELF